ncbi:MAG: TIGR03936 family radical SAM-associated protein [Acidimicrobiales bacterium]
MRLRLRFTKLGKVRFLGHRDLARVWERTLRRAELPVAYSEGFSPRPKVAFGLALSTGYESLGEYLDVDLDTSVRPVELVTLADRLSAFLPDGIDVTAACEVSRSEPSLQQAVTSCSWSIEVVDVTVDEATAITERALDAPALVLTRERKGKQVTDDLRPALLDLRVVGPTDTGVQLEAELGTQPRTLRPAELLAALDPPLTEGLVRRTHQWMTSDGARRDVIPVDATSAQHVGERAS